MEHGLVTQKFIFQFFRGLRSVLIEKCVKKFNLPPLKIAAYEGYTNNNHISINSEKKHSKKY